MEVKLEGVLMQMHSRLLDDHFSFICHQNQAVQQRFKCTSCMPGMVVHVCNLLTQEAQAGESLQLQSQPELHSKALFQKINQ